MFNSCSFSSRKEKKLKQKKNNHEVVINLLHFITLDFNGSAEKHRKLINWRSAVALINICQKRTIILFTFPILNPSFTFDKRKWESNELKDHITYSAPWNTDESEKTTLPSHYSPVNSHPFMPFANTQLIKNTELEFNFDIYKKCSVTIWGICFSKAI